MRVSFESIDLPISAQNYGDDLSTMLVKIMDSNIFAHLSEEHVKSFQGVACGLKYNIYMNLWTDWNVLNPHTTMQR